MAYATITDQEIDPDSPVTTGLVAKLRDNPIAIALANAGAPRVRLDALNNAFIFHAYSTSASITIPPFVTSPTGGMVIMIFLQYSNTAEQNQYSATASVDGVALVTSAAWAGQSSSNFIATTVSNAQHTVSFSYSDGSFSSTVVAIAA